MKLKQFFAVKKSAATKDSNDPKRPLPPTEAPSKPTLSAPATAPSPSCRPAPTPAPCRAIPGKKPSAGHSPLRQRTLDHAFWQGLPSTPLKVPVPLANEAAQPKPQPPPIPTTLLPVPPTLTKKRSYKDLIEETSAGTPTEPTVLKPRKKKSLQVLYSKQLHAWDRHRCPPVPDPPLLSRPREPHKACNTHICMAPNDGACPHIRTARRRSALLGSEVRATLRRQKSAPLLDSLKWTFTAPESYLSRRSQYYTISLDAAKQRLKADSLAASSSTLATASLAIQPQVTKLPTRCTAPVAPPSADGIVRPGSLALAAHRRIRRPSPWCCPVGDTQSPPSVPKDNDPPTQDPK
ncbi:hypothetical protein H4R35_002436 [Dimargaris xerosporica]|nr:hypothetical protein H4R35_002436 [Dimargaris xerosporica]